MVSTEMTYSGPIPLPDTLRQYNEIVPGSAQQIIDAVYQAPGRRQDELSKAEVLVAKRGQNAAIFLAVLSVGAAIVFFATGNNIAGGAFLGIPLVQLILSFFPNTNRREGSQTQV
jgi:uncharacterized membrane protein